MLFVLYAVFIFTRWYMSNLKKLTLLHSNDLHSDFTCEVVEDKVIGGISFLSGYINETRQKEDNVIYAVAGDMLRGSVIDSEYKGLSTIEIMNMLSPDVACVGNHEFDYGVPHLLFIEKSARFPIISANIYVKNTRAHLFRSHFVKKIDGMKILFIGVVTRDILKMDEDGTPVKNYVDVHNAAKEINKICNRYRNTEFDLTVLLTHLGFEEDKKLAKMLDIDSHVDIIIGGHSHTTLYEPCIVNGIPIVQAATGANKLGRFDIVIDADQHKIHSYEWELIDISEDNCPRDRSLERVIQKYKHVTDQKYSRYVTRLERQITHPRRDCETEVGKLFCDVIRDYFGLDLAIIASGSLRNETFGPIVEYGDLLEMYPFGDELYRITIKGCHIKKMIHHIFRPEVFGGVHTEFYQFSKGMEVIVSASEKAVKSIKFNGEEIDDDTVFNVGIQGFHMKNIVKCLGLTKEDITSVRPFRLIATKDSDIVDEYLTETEYIEIPTDTRWITVD